ncbi:amino acid/polyamine transporter I [Aspergillus pseudonomiae]|uniref:Amino acid/polyamine transporter I n=1 Tax=Aspergillus pseudonomiae TaxID=1506151 RepID=A0A5N7CTG8_9EURO|nr:amino acid/polyamine transporter I [Aspergillus pseudonomiae]KAE8397501.1 amino acid/polyamine transporter I [Aspergillus pseudonomiae]
MCVRRSPQLSGEALIGGHNDTSGFVTIGIQFSVTAPPLAIASYTTLITGVGGSPFYFWGFLVAVLGQTLVAVSLAELASAYPHTSGKGLVHIFWTGILSNRQWAPFLSYFNGVMTTFAWIFAASGNAVFAAQFIASFGQLVSDTYRPSAWQIFLLSLASIIMALVFNTLLINCLPGLTMFMVVFLNVAALFIWITLLAVVQPKASAKTAFIDVVNETGWSSDGLVFFLGLLPGMMTVCLFDAAVHMAEELPHPHRQVPIAMVTNSLLAALGGLLMVICLIFCTTRPENLLQPLAGMSVIQICWDAWPSTAFVIVVCLIYCIMTLNGLVSIITGGSRVLWSFVRAGGLPTRTLLSRVNHRLQTPVNAVLAAGLACAIFTVLCFAPSSALSGLFGASAVCFATSYAMPICLLLANRRRIPSDRYFSLGRAGFVVNIVAIAWMTISTLFVCFPQFVPVDMDTMNWAPVVFGVVVLISLANWFVVRMVYELPRPLER